MSVSNVNKTLRSETETFDFKSETETFDFGSEFWVRDRDILEDLAYKCTVGLCVFQGYHDDDQVSSLTYSLTT